MPAPPVRLQRGFRRRVVYGLCRSRWGVWPSSVIVRLLNLKQKTPVARAWGERHSHAVPPKITSSALGCQHLSSAVTGRPVGHTRAAAGAFWFTLAGGFPRAL